MRATGKPRQAAPNQAAPNQAEQRARRRVGKRVVYGGTFSARLEIAEVAAPLATRVAATDSPLAIRRLVLTLVDSVHELTGTVAGWVAEVDARARTEHLADEPGKRRAAMTLIADMAPRPALPEISDAMILDGSWVAPLVAMAAPVDTPLAALLKRSYPPGAEPLRGSLSRSERLERLMRDTLDRAALALERGCERAERLADEAVATAPADPRAELARLGVTL